jgi:hypothetical protein
MHYAGRPYRSHKMLRRARVAIVAVLLVLGCKSQSTSSAPDADVLRSGLVSLLDDGKQTRIKLDSFVALEGRFVQAPIQGAYVLMFHAVAHFTEDVYYAGPSVMDDRIRIAGRTDDSTFRKAGYSVQRGDQLKLGGTLGFVNNGNTWTLEPHVTELKVTRGEHSGKQHDLP